MEYLDVVDMQGNPTGERVERTKAHREGYRHRTSHVWIVRKKHGSVEILLQKRCKGKDSFPECYDISSAGHIPAGDDYVESALRELKEELGIEVREEELLDCGLMHYDITSSFHGETFVDKQVAKVFLLWKDMEEAEFALQKEEIDSVMWIDFEQCKDAVKRNTIPNCIEIQELYMLEKHF